MSEVHIASFIGRCEPNDTAKMQALIEQRDGCEVHGSDAVGKLIIVIEGASHGDIANQFEQLRALAGLLDLQPVYHEYFEAEVC